MRSKSGAWEVLLGEWKACRAWKRELEGKLRTRHQVGVRKEGRREGERKER